jgi:SNF2 family DNA or RNA helicase
MFSTLSMLESFHALLEGRKKNHALQNSSGTASLPSGATSSWSYPSSSFGSQTTEQELSLSAPINESKTLSFPFSSSASTSDTSVPQQLNKKTAVLSSPAVDFSTSATGKNSNADNDGQKEKKRKHDAVFATSDGDDTNSAINSKNNNNDSMKKEAEREVGQKMQESLDPLQPFHFSALMERMKKASDWFGPQVVNEFAMQTELRPWQRDGLAWMMLREKLHWFIDPQLFPGSGINCDEMGLGKTISMIALIFSHTAGEFTSSSFSASGSGVRRESVQHFYGSVPFGVVKCANEKRLQMAASTGRSLRPNRQTLIICPVGLIEQWKREVEKHTRADYGARVFVMHGPVQSRGMRRMPTQEFITDISSYDIVISGYQYVANHMDLLGQVEWFRIVLDEAHQIRNENTHVFSRLMHLRASFRWCVSGSPINNNMKDLRALVRWLRFAPYNDNEVWERYIEPQQAAHQQQHRERERKCGKFVGTPNPSSLSSLSAADPDCDFPFSSFYTDAVVSSSSSLSLESSPALAGPQIRYNIEHLRNMTSLLMLHRTKELLQLPGCTQEDIIVEFTEVERDCYNRIWQESKLKQEEVDKIFKNAYDTAMQFGAVMNSIFLVEKSLRARAVSNNAGASGKKSGINILHSLLRLQQCCNHWKLSNVAHNKKKILSLLDGETDDNDASEGSEDDPDSVFCDQKKQVDKNKKDRNNDESDDFLYTSPFSVPPPAPASSSTPHPLNITKTYNTNNGGASSNSSGGGGNVYLVNKTKEQEKTSIVDAMVRNPSSKLQRVVADVVRVLRENEDEKCIVFSQWVTVLRALGKMLAEQHRVETLQIDGSATPAERTAIQKEFLSEYMPGAGTPRVLLASIKVCGQGLNLQAANRAFIVEPCYNPTWERQAVDRLHRMGQTRPVYVYKYTVADSIEQRIRDIQQQKGSLVQDVLVSQSSSSSLQN